MQGSRASTEDLNLSSSKYEWLLTSFYCTYITFRWMTLLYRVIPAHIYISLCVLSWSLFASFQAMAGSFLSIFILRALLGVREAAFSWNTISALIFLQAGRASVPNRTVYISCTSCEFVGKQFRVADNNGRGSYPNCSMETAASS